MTDPERIAATYTKDALHEVIRNLRNARGKYATGPIEDVDALTTRLWPLIEAAEETTDLMDKTNIRSLSPSIAKRLKRLRTALRDLFGGKP